MSEIGTLTAALAARYTIDREIGRGGMATVYLAHDVRHDRDVAIKVLHPDLGAALGGERFLAEIKTTAKLQHPHILPLLDSGQAGGLLYYVMPHVTGETLRARLEREGQLPIEDAVRIAREVGDALGAAHANGIVHRDIKPENILLQGGHALVADFGIALAVQQAGDGRMTQTGLSLGTPQYMSPEQAMGEKNIDARSDIYALAAVTYEMLAGEPPFTGPTVQAIVSRVMTEEPRTLSVQRKTVPAGVEHAVLRGLQKLPADRYSTAAEFVRALDTDQFSTSAATASSPGAIRRSWTRFVPWGIAAIMTLVALGFANSQRSSSAIGMVVSTILPPEGESFTEGNSFGTISPDGRLFAFAALNARGESRLWVRRLDSLSSIPLIGTEGAHAPFFSVDGAMIGFFVGDALAIVEVSGGTPRSLCSIPSAFAGAWGAHNVIAVTAREGVYRVNVSTGDCKLAIKHDEKTPNAAQHPSMLDDGRHVLFTPSGFLGGINEGDLDAGTVQTLEPSAQDPTFVPPDLIVFGRGDLSGTTNTLWVQRFNPRRSSLVGAAVRIPGEVRTAAGVFAYAASRSGGIVYLPGRPDLGELITDRAGRTLDSVSAPGTWTFQWAHSNPWIADAGGPSLLISDVIHRTNQPHASHQSVTSPVWSPRDSAIAYMSCDSIQRCGISIMHRADGQESKLTELSRAVPWPSSWSSDGRYLLYTTGMEFMYRRGEIEAYDFREKVVVPVIRETFSVAEGALSPDDRWLAYRSDETGSSDVWVRPFLRAGAPRRISTAGGRTPRWRSDGRELYYETPDGHVMVVEISAGTDFTAGAPHVLFAVPEWTRQTFSDVWATPFDVSGDGQRFAVRMSAASNAAVLVQNWRTLIK